MEANVAILDVVLNLLPILDYLHIRGIVAIDRSKAEPEVTVMSKLFKEMFGDVPREKDGYARATYNGIHFKAWIPPEGA